MNLIPFAILELEIREEGNGFQWNFFAGASGKQGLTMPSEQYVQKMVSVNTILIGIL